MIKFRAKYHCHANPGEINSHSPRMNRHSNGSNIPTLLYSSAIASCASALAPQCLHAQLPQSNPITLGSSFKLLFFEYGLIRLLPMATFDGSDFKTSMEYSKASGNGYSLVGFEACVFDVGFKCSLMSSHM